MVERLAFLKSFRRSYLLSQRPWPRHVERLAFLKSFRRTRLPRGVVRMSC